MKAFLLDNSALNNILNSDDVTNQIIGLLEKKHNRIIVSMDTLIESFQGDIRFAANRAARLHILIKRLPPEQFIVAKPIISWLQKEIKNKGRLANVPTMLNSQRWPGFLELLQNSKKFESFHQKLEPYTREEQSRREALAKADRAFRALAPGALALEDIINDIMELDLKQKAPHLISFAPALGISKKQAKSIMNLPTKSYKIHRTYLVSMYLRSLGNAIGDFEKIKSLQFLKKISTGNWFDLAIIVQASLFHYLVTNDNDQRAICTFLKNKGIHNAIGIQFNEFVEQIS